MRTASAPTSAPARATVAVGGLAWLGAAGLAGTPLAGSWSWWLALAVFGGAWVTARILTRDIAERQADQIDEYELSQRLVVRNLGYLLALVAALVLYVVFAVAVNLGERGEDQLLYNAPHLIAAAFLPAAAAPTFRVAWRMRPEQATDE